MHGTTARSDDGFRVEGATVDHPGFTLGPLTFAIAPGEIVALVGANGAGKTTALDLLAGSHPATTGFVHAGGPGVAPARRCGYLTDAEDLPEDLTALEMWTLIATLVADDVAGRRSLLEGADALAKRLRFDQDDQFLGTLSHGNQQKAKLVATLLVRPDRLLLDEPRNGLDPVAIKVLGDLIDEHAADGTPVVVATHDLHYAERAATRVIALHEGTVRYDGPVSAVPGGSLERWYVDLATGPTT